MVCVCVGDCVGNNGLLSKGCEEGRCSLWRAQSLSGANVLWSPTWCGNNILSVQKYMRLKPLSVCWHVVLLHACRTQFCWHVVPVHACRTQFCWHVVPVHAFRAQLCWHVVLLHANSRVSGEQARTSFSWASAPLKQSGWVF